MLHLVGKNKGFVHPRTAQRHHESGEYIRITSGVYCEEADLTDFAYFLKENAVRIANYLFPGTVLVQASAYLKGTVSAPSSRDPKRQRLFLGGKYARTVVLPNPETGDERLKHMPRLEIVQSNLLKNPYVINYSVPYRDSIGPYGAVKIKCSMDELIFIQNFGRRRYNLERFLPDDLLVQLRQRLEEKHDKELFGQLRNVTEVVGDFTEEVDRALAYLRTPIDELQENRVRKLYEFEGAVLGRPAFTLDFDGVTWAYDEKRKEGWMLPLTLQKNLRPGEPPAFISNLLPEGQLREAMLVRMGSSKSFGEMLSHSQRYLGNITIIQKKDIGDLRRIPIDMLDGRLKDFDCGQGVFSGKVMHLPEISQSFRSEVDELMTRKSMTRMSGHQAKVPMYLDSKGVICPADNLPFTHIMKLPGMGNDPDMLRGAVEWASMTLARGAGIKTCEFAMVELSGGVLGYMVERFDIAQGEEDMRVMLQEDLCSVSGDVADDKFNGTAEQVVDMVKEFSTNTAADGDQLFRQFVANYLLENADFHKKNLAFLKVASPTLDSFRSVRLAPAFDIMRTTFFPKMPLFPDEREPMVFPINRRDINIRVSDFVTLGKRLDMTPEKSVEIVYEVASGIAQEANRLAYDLPPVLDKYPKAKEVVLKTCEFAVRCCNEMFPEIPALLEKSEENNTARLSMSPG